MNHTEPAHPHHAVPDPAGTARARAREIAWTLLRTMLALLLQPHRWGELAALQANMDAAIADLMLENLLALPEAAHMRDRIHSVRVVWRGARLHFDVLDGAGRSLLAMDDAEDDPGAPAQAQPALEPIQNAHLRSPFWSSSPSPVARHRDDPVSCRYLAARAALQRFSQALRVATLAPQAPP
jgi:hypothetical protein